MNSTGQAGSGSLEDSKPDALQPGPRMLLGPKILRRFMKNRGARAGVPGEILA